MKEIKITTNTENEGKTIFTIEVPFELEKVAPVDVLDFLQTYFSENSAKPNKIVIPKLKPNNVTKFKKIQSCHHRYKHIVRKERNVAKKHESRSCKRHKCSVKLRKFGEERYSEHKLGNKYECCSDSGKIEKLWKHVQAARQLFKKYLKYRIYSENEEISYADRL